MCLERLDPHISGMVTTMCNHQFHHSCLKKYKAAACPVCRVSIAKSGHAKAKTNFPVTKQST